MHVSASPNVIADKYNVANEAWLAHARQSSSERNCRELKGCERGVAHNQQMIRVPTPSHATAREHTPTKA